MRRLILFRHGKAEMAGVTGGDRERGLTDRGRADSTRTAEWLRGSGFAPDVVLVSPALRTLTTWECASTSFPSARAEVLPLLYLAEAETLLGLLEETPDTADTVMVVGHNPGLQELGLRLAEDGHAPEAQIDRIGDGFPTAAAAVFRMGGEGEVTLEALYEPPRGGGDRPRWSYARDQPEVGA
jgi:phosphohistidine phosphatase